MKIIETIGNKNSFAELLVERSLLQVSTGNNKLQFFLSTLHHLLQIEFGNSLQHSLQSWSFEQNFYAPHCHLQWQWAFSQKRNDAPTNLLIYYFNFCLERVRTDITVRSST